MSASSQHPLQPFFAILGPFLLGKASHGDTVQRLYGDAACGPAKTDAERLAIYGRFCRTHRHQALSLFSATRQAIVDGLGEPAWDELVERYFVAHPMHHFELNQNGEHFPQFLAERLADPEATELPPFVAELADFEWWEWQVRVAPDDQDEEESGPLRLAGTVDLRPYHHDFVAWLDSEPDARAATPEAGDTLVLFFRDRSLAARREPVQPLELVILKALIEGIPLDEALAAQVGVAWADLAATLDDLHAAGIVVGAR